MNISQLIFTHKNISKATLNHYNHTIQNGIFFVVNLHIYVARAIFLLFYDYFMMKKILNLINWKYK